MVKLRVQLKNVQSVALGGTALVEIPCGPRYHAVILAVGYTSGTNTIAGVCAQLGDIRVKVNGRVQRTHSATQLRDMNLLNGTAYDFLGVPNTAPGVTIPIFFAEPWRENPADMDGLAWPTAGWNSFQIEIDFNAAVASASAPTLQAWAVADTFVPPNPPGIVKVIRQLIPAAGTSFDWTTMDRRDYLQSLLIYPDSGGSNQPSQVTLKKDGVILHELTYAINKQLLTESEMTPAASGRTANVYDLELDHDGLLGSAVLMDGTRDVILTIAAASAMSGTSTVLVTRLGTPE